MASHVARRRFLAAAAAGALAPAAGAALHARAAAATPETINVALVGAGTQGQVLLNACAKLQGVRIKALCDIWADYNLVNASRLLEKFKHEHATYTDLKELLAKERDIHAAIIATPDFCHAEQTLACLAAGLHVYCESPMAHTPEDARRMLRAAHDTGKLLQIGYQRRSSARYLHCAEKLVKEVKLLGRLVSAYAQWNRPLQTERGFPRRAPLADDVLKAYGYGTMQRFRNWEWYRDLSAGPLAVLSSHQLDAVGWFLGTAPARVMASGGIDGGEKKTRETPDTALALLEYELPQGVVRVGLQLLSANGYLGAQERFLGDQGTIVVSEGRGQTELFREQSALDWNRWIDLGYLKKPEDKGAEPPPAARGTGVTESVRPPVYHLPDLPEEPPATPHLANFFAAVGGTAALRCGPEDGAAAVAVVAKITEALGSGARVACDPAEWKA
jgi:predicted dehydrogenase